MAGRALVCLLLVTCLTVNFIDCGRSSGGSRGGGSRGGGSHSSGGYGHSSGGYGHSSGSYGHSSGGHSSYGGSSYSKPSYSTGSLPSPGLSSFGLGYGKPSSHPASTGLSGSGSGYGKSSYPASTGLSGSSSGNGKSSYPASTGLSGSGSGYGKSSYPASTGLSGSGSGYGKSSIPASTGWSGSSSGNGKSIYPASTGLSGSGSGYGKSSIPASTGWSGSSSGNGKSIYPASTGLSGSGSVYGKPSYPASTGNSWSSLANNKPSVSHSYPSTSTGLSGSGSGYGSSGYGKVSNNNYNNHNNYNSHSSYHPKQYSNTHSGYNPGHPYYTPPTFHTYYSSPQYVYVQQYRNSGSRYGDLLTGLAIYNLGRSHSHYHSHYYHDDYYRQRYNSYGTASNNPQTYAACMLRIKENGRDELLKIPCEIVSTFTKSGERIAEPVSNTIVCVTNTTTVNNTAPAVTVSSPSPVTSHTSSTIEASQPPISIPVLPNSTIDNSALQAAVAAAMDTLAIKPLDPAPYMPKVVEINPPTVPVTMPITSNISVVNTTHCVTTVGKDPLQVKGALPDPSRMQCSVEIHTNGSILRNQVDCNILIEQARKPEPKKNSILPPRHKLKHWMEKLPWWFSMFIAV